MSAEGIEAVEEANAAFYRAVESANIERMEEAWAREEWIRCVHPGWDVIIGWKRVRESWERIFEGGQNMRISPSDVYAHTAGDFAWVTCTENITVFDKSSFDTAQTVATNLFVRREGRWLMVHHHASAIPLTVFDDSDDVIQ